MGGKKVSVEDRLARLNRIQRRRKAEFSSNPPPKAETIAEEPLKFVRAQVEPAPTADQVEQTPHPDMPQLGHIMENMATPDLLNFMKEMCRTEGIGTQEDLANRFPDLALLAMKRGILLSIFEKPADDATRNVRPAPPAPNPLPSPASVSAARQDDNKVTAPGSGVYDPTTAVQTSVAGQAADELSQFIQDLKNAEIPSREKYDVAQQKYEEDYQFFMDEYGSRAKSIIKSAKEKAKDGRLLEPEEGFVLKLFELQGLVLKYSKIAQGESEARHLQEEQAMKPPITHSTGPQDLGSGSLESIELDIEIEPSLSFEPVVEAPPQQPAAIVRKAPPRPPPPRRMEKEDGWFVKIVKNPMTWAITSIGAYSAAMHITGAWEVISDGVARLAHSVPYLRDIHLPRLPGSGIQLEEVIWYGLIAIGIGTSELTRRRAVRREEQRLERRAALSKKAQDNYSYVAQKLSSVRAVTNDLSVQLINLRAMLVADEVLFDAVDRLYKDELIWNDIMNESRLDEAVRNEFSTIRNQAESEIIKKRLIEIFPYVGSSDHRRMKLKELYLTDNLFQRKVKEVFEQEDGGGYVNRDLRERLTTLKYDNPIPREHQREFLRLLEEDYRVILADNDVHR